MKDKLPEISKEKQKLLSRINRLSGQITAVERAVADGDECADILMLLAAIRGGVNSLMRRYWKITAACTSLIPIAEWRRRRN